MDDFNKLQQKPSKKMNGIWWLYVIVGCFIVCLLIWMFMAISENQAKYHSIESEGIETVQTAS